MQILVSQPWVERLGMTLLHFLWQGLFIVILYAAARRSVARTSSPQTRYLLACGALAAMIAAPIVTWELMAPSNASPEAIYRIRSTPQAATAAGIATTTTWPDSVRATMSSVQSEQFLFWVVMVWLAGAMVFWVRLAGGWVVAARLRSMLVRRAPPEWQETLGKLGAQIGLSRPARLPVSALVQVPTVVGWLRPVVLVPVGALGGLPAAHLEALLLHELAHIRRHDYPINILQSVAESLLFYQPAVWWVSGHIRAERELCCDDVAVSISGDVLTYARALAQLEAYRPTDPGVAMAASGGSLADRIARLLGQSRPTVRTSLGPGAITVAVLMVAVAYGLFGQPDPRPAFQVASITRTPSSSIDPTHEAMGGGYQPGGRLHMVNLSLRLLIRFAYAPLESPHSMPLLACQVVGPSGWINTESWDIEAKPAGNTDPKHMWLMLQALLADRFKLALHRETREQPVYELRPAKGGLKLGAPKDVVCVSFPPGTPPTHVAGKADCGYVGAAPDSRGARVRGNRVHMTDVIRELSTLLDRPVLDKTGFPGEFDVDLSFTPDDLIRLPLYGASGELMATDANRPNLFSALEEQMGLQLVAAKGPIEVLVIDHAERPRAN